MRKALKSIEFHDREGSRWAIEQSENGTFMVNGYSENNDHMFCELNISLNRLNEIFSIYELGAVEFE